MTQLLKGSLSTDCIDLAEEEILPKLSDYDIFYSIGYLRFIEETKKVDLKVFQISMDDHFAFLPFYIHGNTLYGLRYGGVITNSKDNSFKNYVLDQLTRHCREQKVEKIMLRNNPFTNTIPVGQIINKEPIAFIDLNKDKVDLNGGFSKKHQESLLKARGESLIVDETKERKYLLVFFQFYKNVLLGKGKQEPKFSFFEKLYNHLCGSLNIVYVRDKEQVIAVSIILESGPNIFMMYGAMNETGYEKCAKHLMIYELIFRYKKRGYEKMILGTGVDGQRDAVYHFKNGFTKEETTVYTYGTDI